jgi:hypothetical protein
MLAFTVTLAAMIAAALFGLWVMVRAAIAAGRLAELGVGPGGPTPTRVTAEVITPEAEAASLPRPERAALEPGDSDGA